MDREQNTLDPNRLRVLFIVAVISYLAIVMRIFDLSMVGDSSPMPYDHSVRDLQYGRGDILDRNGVVLATSLKTVSAYSNPRKIKDAHATASLIHKAMPDLSVSYLQKQLSMSRNFVWIKRHLTPKEHERLLHVGVPGIYFIEEQKRVYPQRSLFSHVVGYVDIEGNGLAGVERYFDKFLKEKGMDGSLSLSLDYRIQYLMHDAIAQSIEEHGAVGGAGVMLDANTCEILAMVSLPDFNANDLSKITDEQLFNRASLGVYEMGSVFKGFAFAIALDLGIVKLSDEFDITSPFKIQDRVINDYVHRSGVRSVRDIFVTSSNVGTAKIALKAGGVAQRKYFKDFGFFDYNAVEIYEKSLPIFNKSKNWSDIAVATMSYGHGIAVTSLHAVEAMASLVNGGLRCTTTLLLSANNKIDNECTRVISGDTSRTMRELFYAVTDKGTGRRAGVRGYALGGKTGSADKIVDGSYNKTATLTSFVGAFPINDPRYVFLVIIDEPKEGMKTRKATGGSVAAPVAKTIVERCANVFGLNPLSGGEVNFS